MSGALKPVMAWKILPGDGMGEEGKEFNIIDTGGYIPKSEDMIENHVRLQAKIAAEEADMLILLVNGRSKITSSDHYLARQIQKSQKPYLLVINKIDTSIFFHQALPY